MISRADKIDDSGKVEGYYFLELDKAYVIEQYDASIGHKINPSTLEHSFDNGVSWYSKEQMKDTFENLKYLERTMAVLLDTVTGSRISKPYANLKDIIRVYHEYNSDWVKDLIDN